LTPNYGKRLEAWAQEDLRSVNGQIEFLLREAVKSRRKRANHPEGAPDSDAPTPPPPE
jgi:hypothetical protein